MANNFAKLDRILDRIRTNYDCIAEDLPKAVYLKRAFEDRYFDALKSKTDLQFFLQGEETFLEQFQVEAKVSKERKAAYKERNEGGYAENVLKEFQAGMLKYHEHLALDSKCMREVSLLYGAIHEFIEHYWSGITYYMRSLNSDLSVKVDRLERSISDIHSVSESRPPKFAESYNEMVCNYSGTKPERTRAAQNTIQLAGIWLNNLQKTLKVVIKNAQEELPEDINHALTSLSAIIKDFHLEVFSK